MVEYKNYIKIKQQYKVKMIGWPVNENGSLVDPSSMGLSRLRGYLKRLQDPESTCGFRRMTESEWGEWNKKLESDIDSGLVELPSRKTRIDAGKKRKRHIETPSQGAADRESEHANNKSRAKEPRSKKVATKKTALSTNKQAPKRAQGPTNSSSKRAVSSTSDAGNSTTTAINTTAPMVARATPASTTSTTDVLPSLAGPDPALTNPTAFNQADFNFQAVEVHPTAPEWPARVHSRPSTPRPTSSPCLATQQQPDPHPARSPSTPQRAFRIFVNTPESYAARVNTPRRARSRSPATFLLDPTLVNAQIIPPAAE